MTSSAELFGSGLKYPLEVDGAGRLVTTSGSDRLWDTIQAIIDTPRGTCPLDPEFGVDLGVYDVVSNATAIAWEVARAIERSEPRAAAIDVEVLEADAEEGTLSLRITVTPIGSQVPQNRILNVWAQQG